MKKMTLFLILTFAACAAGFGQTTSNPWVTAYYQDYGVCAMPPASVDYTALTHIIYFHTDVDVNVAPYFLPVVSAAESVRVEWSNSTQGCARTSGESYQAELIRRSHAAGVKVLLCVGGIWGSGADRMALIAVDSVKTQLWANSMVAYLVRKGFDGIDLDWEFPRVQGDYMRMLRILRRGLDSMPARGIFAAAVYGDANSSAYDYPNLKNYLDQVNVMTYDMWNNQNTVWLNSPLGKAAGSPSNWRTWRASSALSWAAKGVPKSILSNGIPFYSWKFSGVTALGQSLAGYNYATYADAVNALAAGGTYRWDDSAKAPYVTYTSGGVNYLITYDDTNSVKHKVQRIKDDGIGGVMIYGLWDGWLSSAPAGKKDGLLQAVKAAVGGVTVTPPPPAPSLASPANGAVDLSVAPTLNWNVASGVIASRVQVSASSTFSPTLLDQSGIAGTTATASGLANNTTYYWRVSAMSTTGTSAWSDVRTFTTVAGPPAAPAAPAAISPAQGAADIATSTTLRWGRPAGAQSYALQVSASASFSPLLVDGSGLADTTYRLDSLANAEAYYWRVSATNAYGTSSWSGTSSFTTASVNTASLPVYKDTVQSQWRDNSWNATILYGSTERVYEGNKAIRVDQNAWGGLSMHSGPWGATVTIDPAKYSKFEFAANGGPAGARISVRFENDLGETFPIVNFGSVAANQWAVVSLPMDQLNPNNLPIHRVDILEVAGTVKTYYVDNIHFVGNAEALTLAAPLPVSPAHTTTGMPTSVPFVWGSSAGASSYRLQVSAAPDFAGPVIDAAGLADTAYAASGLAYSTTFYWRVSSSDANGPSAWSAVSSFTTAAAPLAVPAAPALSSPAQTAPGVPAAVSLRWNAVPGAASYQIQLSADSSFSPVFLDQSGLADTAYLADSLAHGTVYYWRVSATNGAGTSPWSAAASFATADPPPAPPAVPMLAFPGGGATGVPTSVSVRWNAVPNAATYRVQLSASSSFSPLLLDQAGLADTSYLAGSMAASTLHYWRVSATNAAGTSPWSAAASFTTADPAPQPPAAPSLVFPASGATGVLTGVQLRWNAAAGAVSYSLQVSVSSSFSSAVIDQSALAETVFTATGLGFSTQYYWRVRATGAAGAGPWSSTRSLTTAASSPSFSASPANLNFGRVGIGLSKKDSLTVNNLGNTTVTITQLQATLPEYSVAAVSGTIDPGKSSKVIVTFAPKQRLTYDAKIAIVINAGNTSDTVYVTGKGATAPRLRSGTTVVNMGNVQPEVLGADTVMMYNDGELDLEITEIQSTSSVFSISPLTAVILPADSQMFVITAQRTTSDAVDGYFLFVYNGANTPDSLHVQLDNATGIGEQPPTAPGSFVLRQNYPNPFNPSTTIAFDLAGPSDVVLKVYNVLGEVLAVLYDGEELGAGRHDVVFQAAELASGIYYYGLTARSAEAEGTFRGDVSITQMRKMLLVK